MEFVKIGRLLKLPNHGIQGFDVHEYAQSPQALVLDDRIRVYFSTRKIDEQGMFTSHVRFLDFTLDLSSVLGHSVDEVIELGPLGSFDEHGIFPFSVFSDQGKVSAYTCGWSRRVSVPVETATGLAYSLDGGVHFSKYGVGPIFSSNLHEPFLVGDSFVKKFKDLYHMWYIYGTKWIPAGDLEPVARVYKIGYAYSLDGKCWNRSNNSPQLIPDVLGVDECQALPSVIEWQGQYHMFFCYRHATDFRANSSRGYRLGYATSVDLVDWIRKDSDLRFIAASDDAFDNDMMCYPSAFVVGKNLWLLYNGDCFGKYGFGAAIHRDPSCE